MHWEDIVGCLKRFTLQCWSDDKRCFKANGVCTMSDRNIGEWELHGTESSEIIKISEKRNS